MRWGLATTALLCAGLYSCGSTEEYENKLSYDPNLKPGQVFFNPDANWVKQWEKTPAPKVPTQVSVADLKLQAENPRPPEQVAWTVMKPGEKPQTLPVGTKPAEVLVPVPAVAQANAPVASPVVASASPVTTETPQASPTPTEETASAVTTGEPSAAPTAGHVAYRARALASEEYAKAAQSAVHSPRPILTPAVTMPLMNSLAVESIRLSIYEKQSYSWHSAAVRPESFRADDGSLLNAYFFVRRRKETWKNLSRIVYGTPSRHAELRAWNNDVPLKVGTALYYASQTRPDDKELLPIVLDKGGDFELTKPRRGEPLTLLGKRLYGEWRTWREIAYFNDIRDPHDIPVEIELRIQPADLSHVVKKSKASSSSSSLRTPASTHNEHE